MLRFSMFSMAVILFHKGYVSIYHKDRQQFSIDPIEDTLICCMITENWQRLSTINDIPLMMAVVPVNTRQEGYTDNLRNPAYPDPMPTRYK